MKALAALLFALAACSCAPCASQPTGQDLSAVRADRNRIVAEYDPSTIERCDFVTFAALYEAFNGNGRSAGVTGLEQIGGKWERHFAPCYPANSRSETTRDGYLAVLHRAWSDQDALLIDRIIFYAEPRAWITGEGDPWVTSVADLAPLMYHMARRPEPLTGLAVDDNPLHGFRGHLLALFIYLRGRVDGSVSEAERLALVELAKAEPRSPIYAALLARFSDGNQAEAIEKLLSMPRVVGPFGWGSAPWQVYFMVAAGIMEGR